MGYVVRPRAPTLRKGECRLSDGESRNAIIHTWIQTILTIITFLAAGIAFANSIENTVLKLSWRVARVEERQDTAERIYDRDHGPRPEIFPKPRNP